MKALLHFILFTLCFSVTSSLHAQVSLPYYSGFDNAAERNGWTMYKLGEPVWGNWGIANVDGYSVPSCISHDYSPSSGATVVDDWFVSPGFLLPDGGTLDSVRYAFSGFSVPTTGDTIGVYLILGNQNPASASSIIELKQFRDADYQNDNVYHLLSAITLPATNEMAFIGIRYRNADASSRWLYVRFDNIAVSASTTSIEIPGNQNQLIVYPNPTADKLTIAHTETGGDVFFYDQKGILLCQYALSNGQTSTTFSISQWPMGIYRAVLKGNNTLKCASVARI